MIELLEEVQVDKQMPWNLSVVSVENEAETQAICFELGKSEWAYVTFELASDTAMRVIQDVRVTFPEMVATIGGNLGLFTGMSILSGVEIVFWLWRIILNVVMSLVGKWKSRGGSTTISVEDKAFYNGARGSLNKKQKSWIQPMN